MCIDKERYFENTLASSSSTDDEKTKEVEEEEEDDEAEADDEVAKKLSSALWMTKSKQYKDAAIQIYNRCIEKTTTVTTSTTRNKRRKIDTTTSGTCSSNGNNNNNTDNNNINNNTNNNKNDNNNNNDKHNKPCKEIGTLYCGDMGPQIYLRIQVAKMIKTTMKMKKMITSSEEKDDDDGYNNNKEEQEQEQEQEKEQINYQINELLNDAKDIIMPVIKNGDEHYETCGYFRGRRLSIVTLLDGAYVGTKAMLVTLLKQQEEQNNAEHNKQNNNMDENENNAKIVANNLLQLINNIMCINNNKDNNEVLYGRSGAIHVILYLRHVLNDINFGTNLIVSLAISIINEGLITAKKIKLIEQEKQKQKDDDVCDSDSDNNNHFFPLAWTWHGKLYLGAAHGMCGILHTLLSLNMNEIQQVNNHINNNNQNRKSNNNNNNTNNDYDFFGENTTNTKDNGNIDILILIKECIDIINTNKRYLWPSGNIRSSMASASKSDKLVQWCHGSSGHVLLLLKAYIIYNNYTPYLNKAITISNNVIWKRGLLRKGVGLCHGISGNAYIFLSIARTILLSTSCESSSYESSSSLSSESSCESPSFLKSKKTKLQEAISWIRKAQYFSQFAYEHLGITAISDGPMISSNGTNDKTTTKTTTSSITNNTRPSSNGIRANNAIVVGDSISNTTMGNNTTTNINNNNDIIINNLENVPDRPYSLYEGSAGLCVLLLDLSKVLQLLEEEHYPMSSSAAVANGKKDVIGSSENDNNNDSTFIRNKKKISYYEEILNEIRFPLYEF